MKYSLMSLMLNSDLKITKPNFIHMVMLNDFGYKKENPTIDEVFNFLNEHGIPIKNGYMSFEDYVKFAKDAGYDGVDMMSFHFEIEGKEAKQILEKYNIKLSAVNIVLPFVSANTNEKFNLFLNDAKNIIDKAFDAGCSNILLMPTGYYTDAGISREQAFHYIVKGLKACVEYGNSKGMIINTETLESIAVPYCSCGEMKRVFEAVPDLKYTHDTGNPLTALEDPIEMYEILKDKVVGNFLTCNLPAGAWRIYVVYETKTDGGDNRYINMVDKESVSTQLEAVYEPHFKHYKEDFVKTFAGFFSDEPAFGNVVGFDFDESIGRRDMPLPWSEEVKEMLKEALGSDWNLYLPYLWIGTIEMNDCVNTRYTYMDIITRLYEKNFSSQLGKWCEKHGVEYIGHVVEDSNQHSKLGSGAGHFFRAIGGQHMAGIDVIGGQIIPGGAGLERISLTKGDGEFYHYALGKLGASSGHLGPKKKGRTMCELFGAYGWKLGVRDMRYITDHLLVRGINYLVPHAFSMAEYPDHDYPPHFYARGNNPQFRHFGNLMKYANRMCHILNGGKHVASTAILYHGENEWVGDFMKMQKPARELTENQIEFDFVSMDMLNKLQDYNGKIEDGILNINDVEFRCLVVPYTKYITKELANFIKTAKGVEIIFVDAMPQGITNETCGIEEAELMKSCEICTVVNLEELAGVLQQKGFKEVKLKDKFSDLTYYHYF